MRACMCVPTANLESPPNPSPPYHLAGVYGDGRPMFFAVVSFTHTLNYLFLHFCCNTFSAVRVCVSSLCALAGCCCCCSLREQQKFARWICICFRTCSRWLSSIPHPHHPLWAAETCKLFAFCLYSLHIRAQIVLSLCVKLYIPALEEARVGGGCVIVAAPCFIHIHWE